MNATRFVVEVFGSALMVGLCGCNMAVKDTAGIKQYLQDQGRAEVLALRINDKRGDVNEPDYKRATQLYELAAGAGHGWTRGILLDSKLRRGVDVSLQGYRDSDAAKHMQAFLALDPGLRPLWDPGTAAAVGHFVVAVIVAIEEQNNKRVELALNAMEEEFRRAAWLVPFAEVTPEKVLAKYRDRDRGATAP